MLRALVLALVLANAGFWAWRHGWFPPLNNLVGARPEGEREPERLQRQVDPQRLRLWPPAAASAASQALRNVDTNCADGCTSHGADHRAG